MNKLSQSAGSTVLDAVPIASNLVPFVEHVLPLAFGTHSPFRINEITYCKKGKKNPTKFIVVASYNDQHRFVRDITQTLKFKLETRADTVSKELVAFFWSRR